MPKRARILPDLQAEVIVASRRRCCICFALSNDTTEKQGQIAHLDRDPSNNSRENLAYLCLNHHDQYDSRTSQSKGMMLAELVQYRAQLYRYVSASLPLSDSDVARIVVANLDRPAFRTPFQHESSLPAFREAIADTISAINTGRSTGGQSHSKRDVQDVRLQSALDDLVGRLVALRAAFDDLLKTGEIRHCGCGKADCAVHTMSDKAINEMDMRRREMMISAQEIDPGFRADFYEMGF